MLTAPRLFMPYSRTLIGNRPTIKITQQKIIRNSRGIPLEIRHAQQVGYARDTRKNKYESALQGPTPLRGAYVILGGRVNAKTPLASNPERSDLNLFGVGSVNRLVNEDSTQRFKLKQRQTQPVNIRHRNVGQILRPKDISEIISKSNLKLPLDPAVIYKGRHGFLINVGTWPKLDNINEGISKKLAIKFYPKYHHASAWSEFAKTGLPIKPTAGKKKIKYNINPRTSFYEKKIPNLWGNPQNVRHYNIPIEHLDDIFIISRSETPSLSLTQTIICLWFWSVFNNKLEELPRLDSYWFDRTEQHILSDWQLAIQQGGLSLFIEKPYAQTFIFSASNPGFRQLMFKNQQLENTFYKSKALYKTTRRLIFKFVRKNKNLWLMASIWEQIAVTSVDSKKQILQRQVYIPGNFANENKPWRWRTRGRLGISYYGLMQAYTFAWMRSLNLITNRKAWLTSEDENLTEWDPHWSRSTIVRTTKKNLSHLPIREANSSSTTALNPQGWLAIGKTEAWSGYYLDSIKLDQYLLATYRVRRLRVYFTHRSCEFGLTKHSDLASWPRWLSFGSGRSGHLPRNWTPRLDFGELPVRIQTASKLDYRPSTLWYEVNIPTLNYGELCWDPALDDGWWIIMTYHGVDDAWIALGVTAIIIMQTQSAKVSKRPLPVEAWNGGWPLPSNFFYYHAWTTLGSYTRGQKLMRYWARAQHFFRKEETGFLRTRRRWGVLAGEPLVGAPKKHRAVIQNLRIRFQPTEAGYKLFREVQVNLPYLTTVRSEELEAQRRDGELVYRRTVSTSHGWYSDEELF